MYDIIEKLCQEKGITIYRLALDTGISNQTFHNLKIRSGNLTPQNLLKVAKYFKKPMEYFVR